MHIRPNHDNIAETVRYFVNKGIPLDERFALISCWTPALRICKSIKDRNDSKLSPTSVDISDRQCFMQVVNAATANLTLVNFCNLMIEQQSAPNPVTILHAVQNVYAAIAALNKRTTKVLRVAGVGSYQLVRPALLTAVEMFRTLHQSRLYNEAAYCALVRIAHTSRVAPEFSRGVLLIKPVGATMLMEADQSQEEHWRAEMDCAAGAHCEALAAGAHCAATEEATTAVEVATTAVEVATTAARLASLNL